MPIIQFLVDREEPMLEDEFPELLLQLRPYQRRAAYWMVQREKGTLKASVERTPNQFISPFCVPVDFLDRHSRMFYNPFRQDFLHSKPPLSLHSLYK